MSDEATANRAAGDPPELRSVEARLEKLEQENRTLKIAALGALSVGIVALIAAIVASSGGGSSSSVAHVDEFGSPRLMLGVDKLGASSLLLNNPSGSPQVSLNVSPVGESGLTLVNSKGLPQAGLAVSPQGESGFVLGDATKPRATIKVSANGSAILALLDQNGTGRAILMVMPDGTPVLRFFDEKGAMTHEFPKQAPGNDAERKDGPQAKSGPDSGNKDENN